MIRKSCYFIFGACNVSFAENKRDMTGNREMSKAIFFSQNLFRKQQKFNKLKSSGQEQSDELDKSVTKLKINFDVIKKTSHGQKSHKIVICQKPSRFVLKMRQKNV